MPRSMHLVQNMKLKPEETKQTHWSCTNHMTNIKFIQPALVANMRAAAPRSTSHAKPTSHSGAT